MKAWIALGSNMGNREENIARALKEMKKEGLKLLKISSLIETAPYGRTDQNSFINGVCIVETSCTPEELLECLLSIEKCLGRVRMEHWGPRSIDLDILFYEDNIIDEKNLTVPHPDLQNRRFVLEPLMEISSELMHPVFQKNIVELLQDLDYEEALNWIEQRARFGIKLGLKNIRTLLERLGNPEQRVPCFHIAGTNGKGSVSTYLSYILEEAGYKTGLFTSPFIESFRERFQINHQNISKAQLLKKIQHIKNIVQDMEKENMVPTHFEILTAICFDYFAEEKVDFAVMEVGLGGLYDSTNIIEKPVASLITTIDYDHTEYLGDTLPEIATQKAGIIKENCPVFLYPNPVEVMETIQNIAKEKNAPCFSYEKNKVQNISVSPKGTDFDFQNQRYFVPMSGEHQAYNASLAVLTVEELRKQKRIQFSNEELSKALSKAKLIARMELLQENPMLVLDGSHNMQGIHALKKNLSNYNYHHLILGIGILKDKKHMEMVQTIVPHANTVIVTEIPMERKLSAEDLAEEIRPLNDSVLIEKNIDNALALSISLAKADDLVLWCGSLYLMGEIRKNFFKVSK